MKRSKFVKFASFAMTALMVMGMVASPVFAAGNDPVDVTTVGGLAIDASAVGGDITSRSYNVYQIMKKQTVGDDGQGNPVYQYKLTDDFAGFTSDNFKIDAQNGAITTKDIITLDGNEYPAGTKLSSTENNDNLANTNATLAAMLARELQVYAQENGIAPTKTIDGGDQDEVVYGWYLIVEGANNETEPTGLLATKPILVEVAGATTITVKDASVWFDKFIEDERIPVVDVRGGGSTNAIDYSIGDTIDYKIVTNLPTYAANVDPDTVTFIVRDNPSIGLTVEDEDIVVTAGSTVLTEGEEYTLTRDGNTFALTFDAKFVLENQGTTIVVAYTATLNENAIVNSTEGNTNEGSVEYSTNPGITDDSDTLTDETAAYTFAVDFHKLDGAHATFLDGATFSLEFVGNDGGDVEPEEPIAEKAAPGVLTLIKDENLSTDELDVYRPVKEGETGVTQFVTSGKEIRFYGLATGTYKLSEIEAPSGYAKLSGDIEFTIAVTDSDDNGPTAAEVTTTSEALHIEDTALELTAEGGTVTVDMKLNNYEGVSLPSTGAMTSLFVMGAGAAVVGGGLFFALRKKKDEDEE